MKNKRRDTILSLIRQKDIETQQELTDALSDMGYKVTQATISRDIKELKLVKQQNSNGRYVYSYSDANAKSDNLEKMSIILSKSIVSVKNSQNIIVVKTLIGMAQGAAAAIDAMHNDKILGSIAGDDTIFIVTNGERAAQDFCETLDNLI